jgi:hypothetical protein
VTTFAAMTVELSAKSDSNDAPKAIAFLAIVRLENVEVTGGESLSHVEKITAERPRRGFNTNVQELARMRDVNNKLYRKCCDMLDTKEEKVEDKAASSI